MNEIEILLYGEKKQEFPPLSADATDLGFLLWLEGDIWEEKKGWDGVRGHYTYMVERRKLTKPELRRAKTAIKKLKLIVEPVNACMGFNFGINVYDGPPFPGLPPKLVVSITGHHLDTRFAETWKKLSPLSHNKENEARLKLFGFEPLHDEAHYDY